jgi:hypothetical protein
MELAQRLFDYQVEASDGGWRWVAYRPDGGVAASGIAASKRIAAACIIRTLTRLVGP